MHFKCVLSSPFLLWFCLFCMHSTYICMSFKYVCRLSECIVFELYLGMLFLLDSFIEGDRFKALNDSCAHIGDFDDSDFIS